MSNSARIIATAALVAAFGFLPGTAFADETKAPEPVSSSTSSDISVDVAVCDDTHPCDGSGGGSTGSSAGGAVDEETVSTTVEENTGGSDECTEENPCSISGGDLTKGFQVGAPAVMSANTQELVDTQTVGNVATMSPAGAFVGGLAAGALGAVLGLALYRRRQSS